MTSSESSICFKWNGQDYVVSTSECRTVADLKEKLFKLTNVQPERQKLLGLKTKMGGQVNDTTCVEELSIKANVKIIMMGRRVISLSCLI